MKRISKTFNSSNKRSVKNLHQVLDFLLDRTVVEDEQSRKKISVRTREALNEIIPNVNFDKTGNLNPEIIEQINERVVTKKYQNVKHIAELHKSLQILKAKKFVKNIDLAEEEISQQRLGSTSQDFIRAFQKKYRLPETGSMNSLTEEKLESVITSIAGSKSQPKKLLKVTDPKQLTRTVHKLRLNMQSEKVQNLQKGLAWLGYQIHNTEYKNQTYGKTTQKAIKQLQADRGIPITGDVDSATAKIINAELAKANPVVKNDLKFRVRGSVRDELWNGKSGVTVRIFEKGLRGEGSLLGEQKTFRNGFFDILYTPPQDPQKKTVKSPLHLVVQYIDETGQELASKTFYNVKKVHWTNLTQGKDRYRGISEFEQQIKVLSPLLIANNLKIEDIEQSDTQQDIFFLYKETGLLPEIIIKLSLAHRIANEINQNSILPAAIFYAFLRQNLPPELPSDLFPDEPDEWDEWISRLVEQLTNGIVFLEAEIQLDAIENAFTQNYLPRSLKPRKNDIIQALATLRENYTLTKPILIGDGNLEALLNTSRLDTNQYNLVGQTFIKHQGLNKAFWEDLESNADLAPDVIADFKTTVDLGAIAKNYQPILQVLKAKIDDPAERNFQFARDFAKLSRNEWVNVIGNGGNVPDNIDAEDEIERLNTYAETLRSQSERLFPTVALIAEVGRNNEHGLSQVANVAQFVDTFPDFDLANDNIDKLNLDNGNTLTKEALQEAKAIQRVRRITPSAIAGTALLNEKLHSSVQVYFKGQGRLIESLEKRGITRSEITRIYRLAENQYANILANITRYRSNFFGNNPKAVPNFIYTSEEIEQFKQDIPNLEVLFGSLDYCECKHCSSMYSPTAYLTDLLRFLEEKDAVPAGRNVQDILFDRRPDLANIKLNCENTHTPLPYIDLVNEILENAIPPANRDFSYQSTLSATELRSIPEHIRPDAYLVLRDAPFPMNVCFNLWQEETRIYLQHLGVPRYELMEKFQDRSEPNNKSPLDVDIAAEYFGISSQEQAIIFPSVSEANATKQTEYWKFDPNQSSISVSVFLEKSKLEYHQLLDLLQTKFVNPDINASKINRPVDDCDVDKQTIDQLDLAKLDRMHRFLRLWRRVGWEMWELDLLVRNPKIGNGTLDKNFLVALKLFKKVQQRLSLSVEELLSFYGSINTEIRFTADAASKEIHPLYNRLFLNISVSNPIDTNFELDNIVSGSKPLADHNTTILSALAITDEDFNRLLSKTNGQLSVASLSELHRYSVLAKKLWLSVDDLILLLQITDISDPFANLEQTQNLLEYHTKIKQSGFSLLQLNYVLNYVPESPIGLREEVLVQYIELLRTSLSKLQDELLNSNDTLRERLEKHLSKIPKFVDTDILTKALDLIEGKWDGDEPSRQTFIDDYFAIFIPLDANPAGTLTQENYHDDNQLTPTEESLIANRYDYVLDHLYSYLNVGIIKEQVSSSLSFSNQDADIILSKLDLPGTSLSLLKHLQSETLIEKNSEGNFLNSIDSANFPEIFQVYQLIHKHSLLLNQFKLEPEELDWFVGYYSDVRTLSLENLPLTSPPASSLFISWLNWFRLLEFKRQFPEPEGVTFYNILELGSDNSTDIASLISQLASLTQWSKSNLNQLHKKLKLKHSTTESTLDYTNAETYHRLWDCFQQMHHTGVNANTMFTWADRSDETKETSIAQATRQAAKSKYEVNEWLEKVRPIQDELREKKRNALVGYLIERSLRDETKTITFAGQPIPNPQYWKNSRDLFNYFLIDVEMSACQLTSRIKQAISSVQLFVQRCFLNLESRYVKVPKDDPDLENNWNHWKWMKNYRIWEANRKVFFYPENWIEPELRDDKSPFFKELENEVLQNEITHENVEAAFLNYLQKVDEVSHLEIVGIFHDYSGTQEVVHVIGRTKSIPHIYYHRTYDLDYLNWSPWEKIEVDITGDHLIPVVYNRKLHLFWLVFEEKPIKIKKNPGVQPSDSPTENPEPPRVLEIQLAWTIKKHNGWTPKVISRKKLIHPWQRPHYAYHIYPRYKASNNTLWIDLYLSTTIEFNNTLFYNQFIDDKVYKTRNRFRETYRPWHSSSFVFNGELLSIKLRGLYAFYYMPRDNGEQFESRLISSYQYVHENFGEDGRKIEQLIGSDIGSRLILSPGLHFEYNHQTNNKFHNINSRRLNISTVGSASKSLLSSANALFQVISPMQSLANRPFAYQDSERAFFVKSEWKQILADYQTKISISRYVFYPLYHPYTTLFIRELNRSGLDGLLNRKIQIQPETFFPVNTFNFNNSYQPIAPHEADTTAQRDTVDFSFGGAYSIYNWEMFFHAPMLIAGKLSQNQRFEEAMSWYHYIFDPTNTENLSVPQRYWITKPFFEHTAPDYRQQRIQNLINKIDEFKDQVMAWKNNPFQPHLIARYRPVAYQRNVVMKYIDNLIAWGDRLFRRDTLESINEASLLYILAYELLGERPKSVPSIPRVDKTFKELLQEGALDILGNQKVEVLTENELSLPIRVVPTFEGTEPLPRLETLYFCIPHNDKLTTYWDKVEDRLFKIRNCMNIEGIVRQLPLFAPPIDPALLVKAAAAGVDLGSVLNDLSVPNPNYRFKTLLELASKFCAEVTALGEKLLNVLESKDTEGLAILRSSNEVKLLEAIKEVRQLQIDEANENVAALSASKDVIAKRIEYYKNIPRMNLWELDAGELHSTAFIPEEEARFLNRIGALLHLIPSFTVGASGAGGSPRVTVSYGGSNLASSLGGFAAASGGLASIFRSRANILESQGRYTRGDEENKFQKELAELEDIQLDKQIVAANIRVSIAEEELKNQELQIENVQMEDEYLRNKYTNQQLYSWMLTQISSVYFQAYQLAYDMAKRAEKSFRYELGLKDSSYIQFGYWDSLKKGLLAGDKLMHDLYRMEAAYFDQHKREKELIKHISLAQVAPWCLLQLKTTGECTLDLPEWLFDMDYPGHYMRRIKTVSVTIPCITGPYTGIHCTLSLHSSRIRISNLVGSSYAITDGDTRFNNEYGTIQSIATSHGQNDNGLFELNFSDERYLPFEGAGVISTWGIKMPQTNNQFDFTTISDFIIHIQYTARDGGANLASAAQDYVDNTLPQNGLLLLDLKRQFSIEWHRFLYPSQQEGDQELKITLNAEHYPFYARGKVIKISSLKFLISGENDGDYGIQLNLPNQPTPAPFNISKDSNLNNLHYKELPLTPQPNGQGEWSIKIKRNSDADFKSLPADNIGDILLIVHFQMS